MYTLQVKRQGHYGPHYASKLPGGICHSIKGVKYGHVLCARKPASVHAEGEINN